MKSVGLGLERRGGSLVDWFLFVSRWLGEKLFSPCLILVFVSCCLIFGQPTQPFLCVMVQRKKSLKFLLNLIATLNYKRTSK